jgi:copper oxidase (laccase) domain-containing protein
VRENRRLVQPRWRRIRHMLVSLSQSPQRHRAHPGRRRKARREGDAMVTATPGLALGILTADCAPGLLADPQGQVIGAAHAGWKGALGKDG